jgi:hypothetical protein
MLKSGMDEWHRYVNLFRFLSARCLILVTHGSVLLSGKKMGFVLVFLQELIQGKGVIQGIQEGDPIDLACLAAAGVTILGFTVFLAIKGDDDYVSRDLGRRL